MTINNKLKKNKVTNFEDLTRLRKIFKSKKIGLAHGVFDLLHYGHLLHLEKAKSMCDILIISTFAWFLHKYKFCAFTLTSFYAVAITRITYSIFFNNHFIPINNFSTNH